MTRPSDWPAAAERLKALAGHYEALAPAWGMDMGEDAACMRSALSYIAELEAALEPFARFTPPHTLLGQYLKVRVENVTFHGTHDLSPADFRRAAALQKDTDHGG